MTILTAYNNTPETKAKLLEEYRLHKAEMELLAPPLEPYEKQPLGEPIWMELKRAEDKKKQQQYEKHRKTYPGFKDIFTLVDKNNLSFNQIDEYQFRAKNSKGVFVDWWLGKKKAMRFIDGSYGSYKENMKTLIQEIAKL